MEKQEQHFPVTALPKIVGNVLQEDTLGRFKHRPIVMSNSIVLGSTSVRLRQLIQKWYLIAADSSQVVSMKKLH